MAKRNIIDENPPLGGNENGGEKEPRKRKDPNAPENALFSAPETPNDAGNTFTNPVTGASVTNEIKPYNDPFKQKEIEALSQQRDEDLGYVKDKYLNHKGTYQMLFDNKGSIKDYADQISSYDETIKKLQWGINERIAEQKDNPFYNEKAEELNKKDQEKIDLLTEARDGLQEKQNDINTLKKWGYYDWLKEGNGEEGEFEDYQDLLLAEDDSAVKRVLEVTGSGLSRALSGGASAVEAVRQDAEEYVKSAKTNEQLLEEWKNGDISDEEYVVGLQNRATKDYLDEKGIELDFDMLDENNLSSKFAKDADKYMQMALSGTEGLERFALQAYGGMVPFMADMLIAGATGNILSLGQSAVRDLALGLGSIQSFGEHTKQVYQETGNLKEAMSNGTLHAIESYLVEYFGMDNFTKYMFNPGATAGVGLLQFLSNEALREQVLKGVAEGPLKFFLTQAIAEGSEEVVESMVDPIVDSLSSGKWLTPQQYLETVWDDGNLIKEFALGAMGGGMMAFGGIGFNAVRGSYQINTKYDYNTAEGLLRFGEQIREWLMEQNLDTTNIDNTINNLQTLMNDFNAKKSAVSDAVSFSGEEGVNIPNLAEVTEEMLNAMAPDVAKMIATAKAENDARVNELLQTAQNVLNKRNIRMDASEFLSLNSSKRRAVITTSDFAHTLGVNVGFTNALPRGTNGYWEGDRIVINTKSYVPVVATFVHEMTHSVEGTRSYDFLKKSVVNLLGQSEFDSLTQTKKESKDYQKACKKAYKYAKAHGSTMSEAEFSQDYFEKETVANVVERRLGDYGFVQQLVTNNASLGLRILNHIKEYVTSPAEAKVKRNLERALREYKTNKNSSSSESRYSFTNEKGQELVYDSATLQANRNAVLRLEPIIVEDDTDLAIKTNVSIVDKVHNYFKNKYNNVIHSEEYGDILIDRSAVKNDISHGLTKIKAKGFIAVPEVINKGFLTDLKNNYGGKAEDRIIISAPVSIDGIDYIENVVLRQTKVTSDSKVTKLYLHDIVLTNIKNGMLSFIDQDLNISGTLATDTTSTDTISNPEGKVKYSLNGNGYDGYSMSNNARDAYDEGRKPLSQFTTDDVSDFNEMLKSRNISTEVKSLRAFKDLMYKFGDTGEWHHTSNYYNETPFYSPDEVLDRVTEDDIIEANKPTVKEKTPIYKWKGDLDYLEWGGTRAHPKATKRTLNDVEVEEKGNWYYVYKDGELLFRKGKDTKGVELKNKTPNDAFTQEYVDSRMPDRRYSYESTENAGYHYGAENFDFNRKSETLWQRGGRSTGAFGTGTYFFGNQQEDRYGGKTEHKVDFSDYNLFKPASADDALALHSYLKGLDDNYYGNIENALTFREERLKRFDDLLEFVRSIPRYEATVEDTERIRNEINRLDPRGEMWEKLEDYIDEDTGAIWDTEYFAQDLRRLHEDGYGNDDRGWRIERNAQHVADVLGITLEDLLSLSEKAMREAKADITADSMSQTDSVGTRVMKALGYEGIDVRGIDGLDNSTYGSVIYDLQPETVRYSYGDNGYSDDSSYQGTSAFNGKAPSNEGWYDSIDEAVEAWENGDFEGSATLGMYKNNGIDINNLDFFLNDQRAYRNGNDFTRESISNLRRALNNTKGTITMFRSVPNDVKEGHFRNGDWITPSREYAKDNAEVHGWGDNYRIIEEEVPIDAIWWDGNDINEWGYDDGNNYVYKNTFNNRKLADETTYDDEGNPIPLSQRFDEKNPDVRYSFDNDGITGDNESEEEIHDDFRRLQEESRRMSEDEIQIFHRGRGGFDEGRRRLYKDVIGKELHSRAISNNFDVGSVTNFKGKTVNYYSNVDAQTFHDVFEIIQKRLYSGDAVTLHAEEYYQNNKNYLVADGMGGFSIEPDGNLVSVFSAPGTHLLSSMKEIINAEAFKLDCFASNLQDLPAIYQKQLGSNWKIASLLDFNYDILAEEMGRDYADYFVETYGEAPVAFMVNTPDNVETRHFSSDQYDDAVEWQEQSLNANGKYSLNEFDDYEQGVIDDPTLTDQQKNDLITEHRAGIEQNQAGIERFGALEQGEKPARDIQFAKKIKKGKQATSRFTRTVAESDKMTDAEAQDIQSRVGRGDFTYQTTTNAETIAKAKKLIQDLGYRGSVRYLTTKTDTVENSAVNQEARIMLMWQLGQEGQYGSDDYNKLCAVATLNYSLAGQTVQSARTFKNNTPQGQLFTIESEIRRLQRNIQERFGDGFKIEVPNELMERFIRAKTDAERDQIMEEIARVVAKQVPATLMEKMNAWRYLAMLFNPRTHIKNMASNEIFSEIVYDAKRFVASTLEDIAYKAGWIDTKVQGGINFRDEADRALYKQMLDYYKQTYKEVGFKYSDADAGHEFTGNEFVELVNENRDIFNNKALEWARKHNSQWLTGEDYLASSKVFAKEMVSRMKAKGVSSISELSPEALNEMREEAYLEARKATFNNDNKLANAINRLAKTNNATKLIFDSLIPFKRTPMNLVARGVEFSPVGLLATLTNGAYQLANHKITANMFIDSLASGLTGSAISLLGYWLASKGIFKTKDEDEPARKSAFDETNGEQKYALDFGNATYTIEWADPIIMPLAIGAEVFNKGIEVEDAIDILATTIDPIFETSMLKGIMNSFTTYGNTPTEKFANIAKNTVANYASQYVPTIGGAIARTLDDTRRKTTFKNDNFFEKIIRSNKAKIPFLAETNEPYLDRNGNEVKNEDLGMGVVGRFALNMLSPGYYKSKDIDKYDEELYRLYESTGDISAMPSGETYNLSQDGTKYEFTDSQYTQFEKLRWQTETELVNEFIDSDTYQGMTDAERVETINKVRSYAQKVAKQDFLNEQGVEYEDKELNAVKEAESYGMTPFDYWAYKSDAGTKQAQKIEYLENSGLTDSQKEFLWSTDNYKKSYQEAYDKLFNK